MLRSVIPFRYEVLHSVVRYVIPYFPDSVLVMRTSPQTVRLSEQRWPGLPREESSILQELPGLQAAAGEAT